MLLKVHREKSSNNKNTKKSNDCFTIKIQRHRRSLFIIVDVHAWSCFWDLDAKLLAKHQVVVVVVVVEVLVVVVVVVVVSAGGPSAFRST